MTYGSFFEQLDYMLMQQGENFIQPGDMPTVMHSYGYGKSLSETIENVLCNRRTEEE